MTPREQAYRDENSTALVTGLAIDLSHHQRGLWAATIWCERTSEDQTPINMGFVHSLVGIAPTIETFISSGGSPGNQHSPGRPTVATISGRMRRRTLSFASTFAKT